MMGAPSLQALEEIIAEFLLSCKDKNIKLKPSTFVNSTCIEFGGCRISSDRLKDKGFIFIKPNSNVHPPNVRPKCGQVWYHH